MADLFVFPFLGNYSWYDILFPFLVVCCYYIDIQLIFASYATLLDSFIYSSSLIVDDAPFPQVRESNGFSPGFPLPTLQQLNEAIVELSLFVFYQGSPSFIS